MGDCFKFLRPFQNVGTLLTFKNSLCKPPNFSEEALDVKTRGCLYIMLTQNWQNVIFQIHQCPLIIVGNRWVCFKEALRGKRNTLAAFFSDSEKWQPHESAMTGWLVQRYEKILKDADTTFCDKVNTLENVRHNNKTESNVPLLELLKFNKVRLIFQLLFIKS